MYISLFLYCIENERKKHLCLLIHVQKASTMQQCPNIAHLRQMKIKWHRRIIKFCYPAYFYSHWILLHRARPQIFKLYTVIHNKVFVPFDLFSFCYHGNLCSDLTQIELTWCSFGLRSISDSEGFVKLYWQYIVGVLSYNCKSLEHTLDMKLSFS